MEAAGTRRFAAAALVVLACAEPPAPAPSLDSVEPSRGPEGQAVPLVVHGAWLLPAVSTDFRRGAASTLDATMGASLVGADGSRVALEQVTFEDTATLTAQVPAGTPRGIYDVEVTDARGRVASLAQAFSVVTPAESVARFAFQGISDQHASVPFPVRLLALDGTGALVESFDGTVFLSDDSGTVAPSSLGPFVGGQLQALVTVGAVTPSTALHARDALSHQGDSPAFAVSAGPPVRLAFAAPTPAAVAGSCVGPLTVSLLDAFGFPAVAAADVPIALSAVPGDGVQTFGDGACGTERGSLTIATGEGATTLSVLATVARTLELRAEPLGLPSASLRLEVSPQAPTRLAFRAAPGAVTAGQCSAMFEIAAEDALGNASAPASATPLSVTLTPPGSVALFDDAACEVASAGLSLGPGDAAVRFFIMAGAAGLVHLELAAAAGPALSTGATDLEVTP